MADWVMARATDRAPTYELVDLADWPLPHMDEPTPPVMSQYSGEHTKRWAAKIAEFDGYVFVTPEYNHSTSGVLKNAIDYLYTEWNNKAAAFVGYGTVGGARAVEHLRAVMSGMQVAHVAQQLSFSMFTDFVDWSRFAPGPQHEEAVQILFTQLESWAAALQGSRVPAAPPAHP